MRKARLEKCFVFMAGMPSAGHDVVVAIVAWLRTVWLAILGVAYDLKSDIVIGEAVLEQQHRSTD